MANVCRPKVLLLGQDTPHAAGGLTASPGAITFTLSHRDMPYNMVECSVYPQVPFVFEHGVDSISNAGLPTRKQGMAVFAHA